jgi:hypothetical protein
MVDPLFWLGLSSLLVAMSLTAVFVIALPAALELARAARSAEKLFDLLARELPPTLEAIRLTSLDISDLTEDMDEGIQSAGRVVKQVDQSLEAAQVKTQQAQYAARSLAAGARTAWKTLWRRSDLAIPLEPMTQPQLEVDPKGAQPSQFPDRES